MITRYIQKQLPLLTLLMGLQAGISSCQRIIPSEVDKRPQVHFANVNSYEIFIDKEVKIPIRLNGSIEKEIEVTYELVGKMGKEEYETFPKTLTFGPNKKEETLTIKNKNKSEGPVDMLLEIKDVPSGIREGLINFVSIKFLGNVIAYVHYKTSNISLKRNSEIAVELKDYTGQRIKAPKDLEITAKVEDSSSAKEGEHFEFPEGKVFKIEKGKSEVSIPIKRKTFDKAHTNIKLGVSTPSGIKANSLNGSCTISIEDPIDLSGIYTFDKFTNEKDFSTFENTADAVMTFSTGDKITIKKTDNNEDRYSIEYHIKGNIKSFFPKNNNGTLTFNREIILKEYDQSSCLVFDVSDLNVHFSEKSEHRRTAEVGIKTLKQGDKESLQLLLYDLEPKNYLHGTYEAFKTGNKSKYPLMSYPPTYSFIKEKTDPKMPNN